MEPLTPPGTTPLMFEKIVRFGNKFREIKHYALPFTETYTLRSNDKLRCQMVSNYCRPADAKWHVYCQYDALTYLVSSIRCFNVKC